MALPPRTITYLRPSVILSKQLARSHQRGLDSHIIPRRSFANSHDKAEESSRLPEGFDPDVECLREMTAIEW